MQTRVFDGAENNPPTFIAHNYMPIAKNYTLGAATLSLRKCCSTQSEMDKLSADEQQRS